MKATTAANRTVATTPLVSPTLLAGRYEIVFATPLPAFNRASADAFVALDRQTPSRSLFALVCSTELPIRYEPALALKGTETPGLLPLIEFGPVDLPLQDGRRMALIYEQPLGGRVTDAFARLNETRGSVTGTPVELSRRLLPLILQALRSLGEMGIAHRAIRPNNLWFCDAQDGAAVLGCGLSGPAGYDQPFAFETIERAMAQRTGRGEGSTADDIYALGVTLLMLLCGKDLTHQWTDDELLAAKMAHGSFHALTHGLRVPASIADALRGMLADDEAGRWNIRDIDAWLSGRRITVRVARRNSKAVAPFVFEGTACSDTRALALALTRRPDAALQVIRTSAVDAWVRNSARDPSKAKRIGDLVEYYPSCARLSATLRDEMLVARVALILDPKAPVRCRGLSFAIDGFGPVLAEQFLQGGNSQAAAEIIAQHLVDWRLGKCKSDISPDARWAKEFSVFVDHLQRPQAGYGIERCLYESNPGLHCLSPSVRKACVTGLDALLPALEAAAGGSNRGAHLIDRHAAAFVAARAENDSGGIIASLDDSDPVTSTIATLNVLEWLRRRYPCPSLPRLTTWIGRPLLSVTQAFHSRTERAALEREIQREVATGDLGRLHALVNDPERRRRDHEGFRVAVADYSRAEREAVSLEIAEPQRQITSRAMGMQAAAMIALTAAAVSMCFSLLFALH
jgi:eukaryotic-like serine/threonine-protein kinase